MQSLVQNQQNHTIGGAPRDKHGEFLKDRPPVFSHATDPLEVDDWLREVEKQLNIAQCDDQQKTGGSHLSMNVLPKILLSPGRNLGRILDPTTYPKDW